MCGRRPHLGGRQRHRHRSRTSRKSFWPVPTLASADQFSGTGVGLAIVKKAVERMGGTVGIESELGKGSRFWIELRRFEE